MEYQRQQAEQSGSRQAKQGQVDDGENQQGNGSQRDDCHCRQANGGVLRYELCFAVPFFQLRFHLHLSVGLLGAPVCAILLSDDRFGNRFDVQTGLAGGK